jgi:hypothetical protein
LCGAVCGDISSKILTIALPCFSVHIFIGLPPPMALYCSCIFGVRLLAMNGAKKLELKFFVVVVVVLLVLVANKKNSYHTFALVKVSDPDRRKASKESHIHRLYALDHQDSTS